MTFASLGLIDPLLRTLETLDYRKPTPVQAEAIPAVLKGRDLMAAAQTGTGKTAGFALPVLQRLCTDGPKVMSNTVRALVLVPTRELAEQVYQSLRSYGQDLPLRSYAVYGGVSLNPQMMAPAVRQMVRMQPATSSTSPCRRRRAAKSRRLSGSTMRPSP